VDHVSDFPQAVEMADGGISSERTPLLDGGAVVEHRERVVHAEERCSHRRRLPSTFKTRRFQYFFRMTIFSLVVLFATYVVYTTAAPPLETRHRHGLRLDVLHAEVPMEPVLPMDFPDPTIIQDEDGTWHAFSTNSAGKNIQVARANGFGPLGAWTRLDVDALPDKSWTSGRNTWAPDVKRLDDGSYIMYFSGELPNSHQHCIGVARSDSIAGPYEPLPEPWACPRGEGGAIDAAGFYDEDTGRRYVVYKIDGNSKSGYSPCGTGVDDPKLKTPLMLQEVESDGVTKIGKPVDILDRIAAEDGALVEAPELTKRDDGTYVLFFSSHCFQDPRYDIKYAWSKHIHGPYVRGSQALLQTPDFQLNGPGGMSSGRSNNGDEIMAFHAYCQDKARCLYLTRYGAA